MRNRNHIAARLAARRQWGGLMDLRECQPPTGHRRINPMGRLRANLKDRLRDRA